MKTMDKAITITVNGYDADEVKDWLTKQVGEELRPLIYKEVRAAVDRAVKEAADGLLRDRILSEVEAVLTQGWQPTNEYGEPKGPKETVRDRIRNAFSKRGDGYYDKATLLEKWVEEGVSRVLEATLKEEVKAAREKLRASFDAVLQSKFTDTLRETLGVKVDGK